MKRWIAVPPILLMLLAGLPALPSTLSAEEAPGSANVSGGPQATVVPEGTSGGPTAPGASGAASETMTAPAQAPVLEYREGLVHTVVAGDTLWDLSARHLGSPWLWPELWERNRFITNPHYIYPGIQVVVFPPPPRQYVMDVWEPEPEPEAAAEAETAAPVEEEVPEAPKTVLDIKHLDFVRAGEFLPERPEGIGQIRDGVDSRVAFSQGDKVFLSLDRDIPPGQLLGVYRVRGPVGPPKGSSVSGYVRYLVGILQVTAKEEGRVAAVVRESFEDLSRSDQVREEIPAYSPVVLDPGEENVEAVVLAGRGENTEFATGHVVYLDEGANAGVAVGNVFRIFDGQDTATWGRSRGIRVEVAKVVVVGVLPRTSSAYVVGGTQSFPAGVTARRGAGAQGGTTASR